MTEDFKRTLNERKFENLNKMGKAIWKRDAEVAGVAGANRKMAESWSKVLEVRDQAADRSYRSSLYAMDDKALEVEFM